MIFDIFATGSERQIVRFNILLYGAEVHSSTAPQLHCSTSSPDFPSSKANACRGQCIGTVQSSTELDFPAVAVISKYHILE